MAMLREAFSGLNKLKLEGGEIIVPGECYGCGSRTRVAQIDYEYDWHPFGQSSRFTIAKKLPGLICINELCLLNYQDSRLRDRFLRAVAVGLSSLGDRTLERILERNEQNPLKNALVSPIPSAILEEHPEFGQDYP